MGGINNEIFLNKRFFQDFNYNGGFNKENITNKDLSETFNIETVNNAITSFQNGKISIDELKKVLEENGINTTSEISGNIHSIKFSFNGKDYVFNYRVQAKPVEQPEKKEITEADVKKIESKVDEFSKKKITLEELKSFLQDNYSIELKTDASSNRIYFKFTTDNGLIGNYAVVISGNNTGKIESTNEILTNQALINTLLNEFKSGNKTANDIARELAKLDIQVTINNTKNDTEKISVNYLDKTMTAELNKTDILGGIMKDFTEGNMTIKELTPILKNINIQFYFLEINNSTVLKFTHNNKTYDLRCNSELAASSTDNKTQKTYDYSELEKFASQRVIDEFFEPVIKENSKVLKYALKPGKTYSEFMLSLVEKLDDYNINLYTAPDDGKLTVSKKRTKTAKLLPKLKDNANTYLDTKIKDDAKTKFLAKFKTLLLTQGVPEYYINTQFEILYSNAKEKILEKVAEGDSSLVRRWSTGTFGNKGNVQIIPRVLVETFEKEFNTQCERVVAEMKGAAKLGLTIPEYNQYKEISSQLQENIINPMAETLEVWKDSNKIDKFVEFISTSDLEFNMNNLYDLFREFAGENQDEFGAAITCEILATVIIKDITGLKDRNELSNFLKNNKKSFKELLNKPSALTPDKKAMSTSPTTKSCNTSNGTSTNNQSGTTSNNYGSLISGIIGDLLCGITDLVGDIGTAIVSWTGVGPVGAQALEVGINTAIGSIFAALGEYCDAYAQNRSMDWGTVFDGGLQSGTIAVVSIGGAAYWAKASTKMISLISTIAKDVFLAVKEIIPVDGHKINDSGNNGPRGGGATIYFNNTGFEYNSTGSEYSENGSNGWGGDIGTNSNGQTASIYVGDLTSDIYEDAGIVFLQSCPGGGSVWYDTETDEYIFSSGDNPFTREGYYIRHKANP